MRIAFLIAAHSHPVLLARLVSRICHENATVFIHVDLNVDIKPFQRELARNELLNKVEWAPRVRSKWGTFGQVRASMSLLKKAISTDPRAEMFILISGQDYPLISSTKIVEFFESNAGVSFIRHAPLPWGEWDGNGGIERLSHFHFCWGQHRLEYPSSAELGPRRLKVLYKFCELVLPKTRPLPINVNLYGGFSWWNLTRGAVQSIFNYLDKNPTFPGRFRFSRSSDEIFFQTILKNSYTGPLVDDDLRCVFWDGRRNEHPALVRMDDFEEIRESGKFFVRKVHPVVSDVLLQRIDDEILGLG